MGSESRPLGSAGGDGEDLAAARRENERLCRALCFHAEPRNWERPFAGGGFTDSKAQEDGGHIARQAMGKPV